MTREEHRIELVSCYIAMTPLVLRKASTQCVEEHMKFVTVKVAILGSSGQRSVQACGIVEHAQVDDLTISCWYPDTLVGFVTNIRNTGAMTLDRATNTAVQAEMEQAVLQHQGVAQVIASNPGAPARRRTETGEGDALLTAVVRV